VSEFINPQDIIVELGIVFDNIAIISEFVAISVITATLNINRFETIGVNAGNVALALNPIFVNVFDTVTVIEAVFPHDEEIDLDVFDNISVTEFRLVTAPFDTVDLNIDINDVITATEDTIILVGFLSMFQVDNTSIAEDVSVSLNALNISVFVAISVQDVFDPEHLLAINVFEAVSIIERLVARDSGFTEIPRYIFRFRPIVKVFFSQSERRVEII